ncbi:DnaD domain-containing protein [Cohnella herbarum]|uniref:DnaD domain-containing protein n=1 Tax=Cohnella herbarum TaxID=2728023 RepID=A0A7Z2VFX9_9BACL|nr:DnaD domain-containing protein [Cohnella herbarum]QJD82466.1 DnaD domain-containing protein [Cohnella herbarum]
MNNDRNSLARGMAEAFMDGSVSIPYALLRTYRALKLNDTEGMLLLHLIAYRQLEQNDFPTIEQLQERLGCSPAIVGQTLQKLMKLGFVTIDEVFDPLTGVQSEKYNLAGLFQKMGQMLAAGELPIRGNTGNAAEETGATIGRIQPETSALRPNATVSGSSNLFVLFEQEFGRPLTPFEYETINGWLDQDQYADELIRFALKESVFAGKLHFNYIDRILLGWSRNRVTNVEEARLHAQKFRAGR